MTTYNSAPLIDQSSKPNTHSSKSSSLVSAFWQFAFTDVFYLLKTSLQCRTFTFHGNQISLDQTTAFCFFEPTDIVRLQENPQLSTRLAFAAAINSDDFVESLHTAAYAVTKSCWRGVYSRWFQPPNFFWTSFYLASANHSCWHWPI